MTENEFTLMTDGAGHQDGFGGYSSLLISFRHKKYVPNVGAATGTSVDRMEFEALLMGLQSILDSMGWTKGNHLRMLESTQPKVVWYSDRESLVRSVMRDEHGETVYGRKNAPDLWCRFEFYERLFRITPIHIPRATIQWQDVCDELSSEARQLLKDYYLIKQVNQS